MPSVKDGLVPGESRIAIVTAKVFSDPRFSDPTAFINREMSWLMFARRVLSLAEDPSLPLLERVNFAGLVGMLHDEFFMKRISGLKREQKRRAARLSLDGLRPAEEFNLCREELVDQTLRIARTLLEDLRPALQKASLPILNYEELGESQGLWMRDYFRESVQPILTPLAVDSEHPFPFISNLGLNLAVIFPDNGNGVTRERFVRIKVPDNRPRWVPMPGGDGFVPLEQVIRANLDLMYPDTSPIAVHFFRVTRGAEGERGRQDLADEERPGGIIDQVSRELKARRFAGVVRLQVDAAAPKKLRGWLVKQLDIQEEDVYITEGFLGLSDLLKLRTIDRPELKYQRHEPVTHPRLRGLAGTRAIFEEIARGDILLHHPYHDFDTSVLRMIESAAVDPSVLAIKLTIYRTSSESPIVRSLAEAARRGKQVAVLVEVTARFDEAPNIAWGRFLENEGVHVAYGVEDLKTHVKLALIVREEGQRIRRYAHIGTGNYHAATARLYEDLGVLTSNTEICDEVAAIFNALTGATPYGNHSRMIVAPVSMRQRFRELIRREADHAHAGRPCGIDAKMNQLQDPEIIRELYMASRAGVPIRLNVRGLCCLKPGLAGLSENIQVFSVVGRFLEHSRIYRFENGGDPEYFIGSADWMKRNLNSRVETVAPITDEQLKRELDAILEVYHADNCSAWNCGPDGLYVRRSPREGEEHRAAQEIFIRLARQEAEDQEVGDSTVLASTPDKRA